MKSLVRRTFQGACVSFQIPKSQEDKPANVDAAANLLSQL